MLERCDECIGDVSPRYAIEQRQGQGLLRDDDGAPSTLAIEEDAGADHGVLDGARAKLVLESRAT